MAQIEKAHDLEPEEVKRVAEEIERYLAMRSGSADTLRGVTHWWLMQQRVIEAERMVEQAIHFLCEEGKLEVRHLVDGTDVFIAKKRIQTKT